MIFIELVAFVWARKCRAYFMEDSSWASASIFNFADFDTEFLARYDEVVPSLCSYLV